MIKITEYLINHSRVTTMIIALIVIGGLLTLFTIKREELPHISMEMVKVTTNYPGASPEDVELNVTDKLEQKLREISGIVKLTSISAENLSVIMIQIDPESNLTSKIKTDIRDAVSSVTDLPAQIRNRPSVEEITNDYPMIEIALTGNLPESELRKYARDLENRLKGIRGVGTIDKIGYRDREILIASDPGTMRRLGVSFANIADAVAKKNIRLTGGSLRKSGSEKIIVTSSLYKSPLDVSGTIIRSNEQGYGVKLNELAEISDGFAEPQILYHGNGVPGIGLMITRQENTDIIKLSDEIAGTLERFRRTLPSGIRAEVIADNSILTHTMLGMVLSNALLGFGLVIITMFMMLDWRSAFWAASGVFVSYFGAILLFPVIGISLNTVPLAAMIMLSGMDVDDAVLISERVYSLKRKGMEAVEAAITGTRQMLLDTASTSLTTIIAFLPILLIPGIMGRFSRQLPIVIALILGVSLLESIWLLPSHLAKGGVPRSEPKRIAWMAKLKSIYRSTLSMALPRRKKVLAGFIITLAILLAVSSISIRFMLEEDINPDSFTVAIETPRGSTLARTESIVSEIEKELVRTVPREALKSTSTQIGHHYKSTDYITIGMEHPNWAIISVYLKSAADRDITSEEIIERLRPVLSRMKEKNGLDRLDVESMGFSTGRPIEVSYISDDDRLRNKFKNETISFLTAIKGVMNIETSDMPGPDELRLILDHPMLAKTNLTGYDVAMTVQAALQGAVVSTLRHSGEDIDYRLCVKNLKSSDAGDILEVPVENPEGRLVPLKHVANFAAATGPSTIHHMEGTRSVTVSASVDPDVITSAKVNSLIRNRFESKTAATPGLRMAFGGEEEEAGISMKGFYFALLVALLAVYFILVLLFDSYTQPMLMISIIPFTVAGVFLTLMIHGRPLVFISLIGLLGLVGVVVNNTIVMISHLNKVCRSAGATIDAVAEGASDRLRPILLTSITTFAGLLPTAYGIGGDLPLIRPMVLVIAWGVMFSSVVTLFFIPVLFSVVKGIKTQSGGKNPINQEITI